jgi:TonB family protein
MKSPIPARSPLSRDALVDLDQVEVRDGRRVAEVIAMLDRTVLDVTHVGQVSGKKARSATWIAMGAALFLGGLGLSAYELSQDWEGYGIAAREAAAAQLPAPSVPGFGTGALGLGLMLLGLVPFSLGFIRASDRVRRDYTIGEGHDVAFTTPGQGLPDSAAFPLVRALGDAGDRFALHFTSAMRGEVVIEGARKSLDELVSSGLAQRVGDGAYAMEMPHGARGRVEHGNVTFLVNAVHPGAVIAGRGEPEWALYGHVGGVAIVAGLFLGLSRMVPDDVLAFDLEEETGSNRFVGFLAQPDMVEEEKVAKLEELEPTETPAGGKGGQRHAGAEGQAGSPSSKKSQGRMSIAGPKDAMPQLARNFDPDLRARSAGILGVMQTQSGHFLASPYGGAFAVGNEDADVWGHLTGTEIGEAHGVGGMALVGTGRYGGGLGEGTIGLSTTGLIGRTAGTGQGVAFGPGDGTGFSERKSRTPVARHGTAEIVGSLDKDIVRRIVRAHINEVRACYQRGLDKNPSLQGRVAISFVITGTGLVGSSAVQESSVADSEVGRCIAKAVKRWKFPKPDRGGNVIVSYPFNLSAG